MWEMGGCGDEEMGRHRDWATAYDSGYESCTDVLGVGAKHDMGDGKLCAMMGRGCTGESMSESV